jgi:hypothetical protein
MKPSAELLIANGLVAALLSALTVLAYDRTVMRPALVVGVVDVGEVYRQKEADFTGMVTQAASEEERQKALQVARQFAQRLPVALEELPRDCGCLVVVRSAIAGIPPHAIDLTPSLKHKVALP